MARSETCQNVVVEASRQGVDPVLAASVAWNESAFIKSAVSRAGAVGPMQVLPRFWCKSKDCDLVEAGVRALKYYTEKYGTNDGLCAYYSGKKCTKETSKYKDSVLRTSERFLELWMDVCNESGC